MVTDEMRKARRIMILGEAGRGKSTLAPRLADALHIPVYSTDDFYYTKKFSEPADKTESIERIRRVYQEDAWIVEGTTRHLLEAGFPRTQLFVYLGFRNLPAQYWALLKRFWTREEETLRGFLVLAKHQFMKRFKLGYAKGVPTLRELIHPHAAPKVYLYTHADIDQFLGRMILARGEEPSIP